MVIFSGLAGSSIGANVVIVLAVAEHSDLGVFR